MNRKLKIIYFFGIISGFLWSDSISSEKIPLHPVNLNIYDGVGSLLLDWSFSDTIKAKETNIYRRSESANEFSLIASLKDGSDKKYRFLDKNCEVLERYFYYIQIKDVVGNIYKSDDIRPAFGSNIEDAKQKTESFYSVQEIISHLIKASFSINHPQVSIDTKNAILKLIFSQKSDKSTWVENFPIRYLDEMKSVLESPPNIIFENNILDEIQFYETIYRNDFLLTPKEWNQEVKDLYHTTKEKWYLLCDSFQAYSDIVESLPPLLITGAENQLNDFNVVNIFAVDIKGFEQNIAFLKYEQEAIKIESLDSLFSGSELQIQTPNTWNYVELIVGDQIVDRIDFIENKKIVKTLYNDIISVNEIKGLYLSKKKSDIWLNEIYWDPSFSRLSLEVAGFSDDNRKHIISVNDIDLWDIDLEHNFDIQYSDSTFNIGLLEIEYPLTLSFDVIDQDQRRSIELVKLISEDIIRSHRLPDGGKWDSANSNTFGSENIDQRDMMDASLIPELFVLYQNYPNPFNSNTRISFDLLQDAVLSLYVTDATGRIKTIFSDKEYFNSGKYDFDWNAENFSTGVYFFTINAEVDGFLPAIFSRKMIYLK